MQIASKSQRQGKGDGHPSRLGADKRLQLLWYERPGLSPLPTCLRGQSFLCNWHLSLVTSTSTSQTVPGLSGRGEGSLGKRKSRGAVEKAATGQQLTLEDQLCSCEVGVSSLDKCRRTALNLRLNSTGRRKRRGARRSAALLEAGVL